VASDTDSGLVSQPAVCRAHAAHCLDSMQCVVVINDPSVSDVIQEMDDPLITGYSKLITGFQKNRVLQPSLPYSMVSHLPSHSLALF